MNLSAETTINPCEDYVRIAKAIAFISQSRPSGMGSRRKRTRLAKAKPPEYFGGFS
jgi:hypothetical protein